MWSDRVIEGPQVGEYIGLCTGPGGILFAINQLTLETVEEIFAHGVVIGIALEGHALPNSIGL